MEKGDARLFDPQSTFTKRPNKSTKHTVATQVCWRLLHCPALVLSKGSHYSGRLRLQRIYHSDVCILRAYVTRRSYIKAKKSEENVAAAQSEIIIH